MIITHTSNPAIDDYLELSDISLSSGLYRADKQYFVPGGKGFNVSIVLNNMGIDSKATCFLGGFSGVFLEEEINKYEHIKLDKVEIDQPNRINIKVRHTLETDINTSGPEISIEKQNEMLEKFEQLEENDWLLVCGRLAKGVGYDFLEKTSEIVRNKKAKLVLDITGLTSEQIKSLKPFLIKPNKVELREMFNELEADSVLANKLLDSVDNVLVTNSASGATLYTKDYVYTVNQPELLTVNSTGAGDSMLAAFVGKLAQGDDVMSALRYGAAAGAASATSLELADVSKIEELLTDVTVIKEKR